MSEPTPQDELPLDKIEMLSQPLLTEEGFVNPACINELVAAIRNVPKTHECLANDPEWSMKQWITDVSITGEFAGCAVRAWRSAPPNLEMVVNYLVSCLRRSPFTETCEADDSFRMAQLSLCDINKLLWDYLGDLPQFKEWNDDSKNAKWIDLDALLHMVCIEIRNERRHDHAFDVKNANMAN